MKNTGWALTVAAAATAMGALPACAQEKGTDAGSGAPAGRMITMVLSPGDTIAITSTGAGPAVVIVPGLLGSTYSFRHVTSALVRAGHRVIVFEPLGTGASARPEVADYTLEGQAMRLLHAMDSVGAGSATLLCHSVGGSICYRAALYSPERVAAIVSINGGPDEHAATAGLRRAMTFAPLIRLLGSGVMRDRLKDGLKSSSADPSWVTEEVVDAYTEPFRDLGRALRGLRGMARADEPVALAPRLPKLKVPVLLLVGMGGEEPAMSEEVLALLEKSIPALTIERIESAGQYIQEEDPAAVVEAVHAAGRAAANSP